jgi:hypothetical protein
MLVDLFLLFIGLMVGWFFLPRPQWAIDLMVWAAAKLPFLAYFVPEAPPAPPPSPPSPSP